MQPTELFNIHIQSKSQTAQPPNQSMIGKRFFPQESTLCSITFVSHDSSRLRSMMWVVLLVVLISSITRVICDTNVARMTHRFAWLESPGEVYTQRVCVRIVSARSRLECAAQCADTTPCVTFAYEGSPAYTCDMLLPAEAEGCNGYLQEETDRIFYKHSDRMLRKETLSVAEKQTNSYVNTSDSSF